MMSKTCEPTFRSATLEPLEPRALLAATRIMPLGDSITHGFDGDATYRYWLWHELAEAGREVDFVGTNRGVFQGAPRFDDFDQDHEGHVGVRVDTVLEHIDEWLTQSPPDVVLVHLGTNDLFQGQSVDSTIVELDQLIDRIRAHVPNVTILLAQLIPSHVWHLQDLNAAIPELAARKTTRVSPVVVVDQYTGFDQDTDLKADHLHPDESGERKMADRWMAALTRVTAPPVDPNPFLSDLPFRVARNGLGPVEVNRSNGGAAAGDGRTIKLNSKLYRHGLGVHAGSDLRFNLDGRYMHFIADAGVDDEVGNRAGSVVFRVYVDGVKRYDSGAVYGRTGTKRVSIDVAGAGELRLLVTDKGDGNAGDHADWADARLFSEASFGAAGMTSGGLSGSTNQSSLWQDLFGQPTSPWDMI